MVSEDGPPTEHLSFLRRIAESARRYGLFPVLRGLEARAPRLPRIGGSLSPAQDVVTLAQTATLSFPGATVDEVSEVRGRASVKSPWFGLTGPMGPLPLHLTEFAVLEQRSGPKRPFSGFLDLIAGRMLQLFYRAWAQSQPSAQADRPAEDGFADVLSAVTGATLGVSERAKFPARARLHYAGLFASPRSAAGIEDALTHLLGAPVRLIEYQPRQRRIEPEDRSRLAQGFNTLGADVVLGRLVFTVTEAFKVVIRTRDLREYEEYLPTGRRHRIVAEALQAFSPSHLDWDIELEIPGPEAKPAALSGSARLGWTSWLGPHLGEAVRADVRLGANSRRFAET